MSAAVSNTGKASPAPDAEGSGSRAAAERSYAFSDLAGSQPGTGSGSLDFILDIPLEITVELGRNRMLINDLLKLGQGSVIELVKLAGETLEVMANQKLIARGEVVVVNDKYGIRLTEIITPLERIERLR